MTQITSPTHTELKKMIFMHNCTWVILLDIQNDSNLIYFDGLWSEVTLHNCTFLTVNWHIYYGLVINCMWNKACATWQGFYKQFFYEIHMKFRVVHIFPVPYGFVIIVCKVSNLRHIWQGFFCDTFMKNHVKG